MDSLNLNTWRKTNHARILIQQKNYSRAKEILKQALQEDINNTDALGLLSQCECERKNYKLANEIIDNALQIDPDNGYLHYLKAHNYHRASMHWQSMYAIDEALRLSPDNSGYLALKAVNEINVGQYYQAGTTVKEGLRLSPNNFDLLRINALVSLHLGNTFVAHGEIDKSLSFNPENSMIYSDKASILLQEDRPDDAIETLQIALRLNPDNTHAKENMLNALKLKIPIVGPLIRKGFRRMTFRDPKGWKWLYIIVVGIISRGLILAWPVVYGIYFSLCSLLAIIFECIISFGKKNRFLLSPEIFYACRIIFWFLPLDAALIAAGIIFSIGPLAQAGEVLLYAILLAGSYNHLHVKGSRLYITLLGGLLGVLWLFTLTASFPVVFYLGGLVCIGLYGVIFALPVNRRINIGRSV